VVNTRPERNIHLPEMAEVRAYTSPMDQSAQARVYTAGGKPADWLGKPMGGGANGTAFRLKVNPTIGYRLRMIRYAMTYGLFKDYPSLGESIVVKVGPQNGLPLGYFLKNSAREVTTHDALMKAKCIELPGFTKPVCPAQYIPKLHFGGLVRDHATGKNAYVIAMGVAPGVVMNKYVQTTKLTADVYVRLERAVIALWLAGFAHGDLHKDNMLYDPQTGHATIIDFGFGVTLPAEMRQKVTQAVVAGIASGVRSLGEVWRESGRSKVGTGLQGYVNRVMWNRERANGLWYNPDGGSLLRLYARLSPTEQANVPGKRRELWGYTGPVTARFVKSPARVTAKNDAKKRLLAAALATPLNASKQGQVNNGPVPMNIDTPSPQPARAVKRKNATRVALAAAGKVRRSNRMALKCKRQGRALNTATGRCVRKRSK